ncbi:hypothetical protein [Lactobacillus ultunensis]|uniref:hypothetical protein n=1 Tax=Lactobacillus ultunensis TaxID=227945 RepID=UPI001914957D|nr:hypothetical protein [Lactobacillus ultunensis]QQP29470.1 hypothetical protein H4B44_05330 [Lactobacillus ultunensis]
MSYIKFQLNKVFKNNLLFITGSLLLVISLVVLALNNSTSKSMSLENQAKGNLIMQNNAITQMKDSLKHYKKGGEAYTLTTKSISDTKKQRKDSKKLLQAFKQQDWQTVYHYQLKAANLAKNIQVKNNHASNSEKSALIKNVKFFEYLNQHPLPYEETPPVTGIQFLLDLNQLYLPYLFILVVTFILTQLYTSKYRNRKDISSLFPISSSKKYIFDNLIGVITSSGLFYSINILVFIIAALFFKVGSVDYPFYLYKSLTGQTLNAYVPTSRVVIPIIVLQILVGLFIINFIQLISSIVRDKFPSLFITLILLIGLSLSSTVIEPLQKVATWLPTTYFNVINVISGEISVQYHNTHITFVSGLITLIIGLMVTYGLGLLINKIKV